MEVRKRAPRGVTFRNMIDCRIWNESIEARLDRKGYKCEYSMTVGLS